MAATHAAVEVSGVVDVGEAGEEPVVDPNPPKNPVVIGSGPTGLATAIMLARRGWKNIQVYDRLSAPPAPDSDEWMNADRSYNVGLNGRGQFSLKTLGVWDRVQKECAEVTGRREWAPGAERPVDTDTAKRRGYSTRVIPRDLLAACLYEELQEKYSDAVTVHFEQQCTKVELRNDGQTDITLQRTRPNKTGGTVTDTRDCNSCLVTDDRPRATVSLSREKEQIMTDFLVGCDGVRSSVRDTLAADKQLKTEGLRVQQYRDENVRVYKTIPLKINKDTNLNYSARGSSGINFDALPSKRGGYLAVIIFRPQDERVLSVETEDDALAFFQAHLPQIVPYLAEESCMLFAAQPVSRFPIFQSCGPKLNRGGECVLLGDAIHTVKPYFGLGVNSAFEDVCVLNECLTKRGGGGADTGGALEMFSRVRGKEALALVDLSRGWDMPGWRGFLKFVLPLILDGTFGGLLPGVFRPNILGWIQNPGRTFTQVRRRKRFDNLVQGTVALVVLSAAVYVAASVASLVLSYLFGHILKIDPLRSVRQVLRNSGYPSDFSELTLALSNQLNKFARTFIQPWGHVLFELAWFLAPGLRPLP